MYLNKMRVVFVICLFFLAFFAWGQEQSRGSIPEELLRPRYGESPRYPIDTVIGEMGQGEASNAAFQFASSLAAGFVSGNTESSSLQTVNVSLRESYLSVLGAIDAGSYRLGGGREEPDGSVSFLVRFLGRERGITGELFIRYVENALAGNWAFEDLLLEEARNREQEHRESLQRFDFSPYERFF